MGSVTETGWRLLLALAEMLRGWRALVFTPVRGVWGIGLLFGLEGMGLPLPAEIPLLLAGALIRSGERSFWTLLLVAWSATVFGNLVGYGAGYLGGRPLLDWVARKLQVSADKLAKYEQWIGQHGLKVLFATRWVNWGFGQSLWVVGINRISPKRFLTFTVVLNLLWAMVWLYLGSLLFGWISHVQGVAVVLLLLVVGAGVWALIRRRKAQRP
ncbi:MAG: DedA family protein [Mycobacterium leprae]